MYWMIFSIVSSIFYAVAASIDKIFEERLIKNPLQYVSFLIATWIPTIPFFLVFDPSFSVNFFYYFVYAILYWVHILFYLYSIKFGNINEVIAILLTYPVPTALLASILIKERLTTLQIIGISLLILGSLFFQEKNKKSKKIRSILFAIFSVITLSISSILAKILVIDDKPITSLFWMNVFIAITGVPFLFKFPKIKFTKEVIKLRSIGLLSVWVADLLWMFAIYFGPVSLVSAIGSSQVLFLWALSQFLSRKYKELITSTNFSQAILGAILISLGTLLIFI